MRHFIPFRSFFRVVTLVSSWSSIVAFPLHAEHLCEVARLFPSDMNVGEEFGVSVSVFDDVLVVGDSEDDERAIDAGAAYIYRHTPHGWQQEAKLVASNGAAEDGFGGSVSVSGDRIIVGSCRNDEGAQDAGAAFVFKREGSTWVEEARLTATDPTTQAFFACSVAISGDAVAIGAVNAGATYVFRRVEATWVQEAKLTPIDKETAEHFVHAVAMSNDAVLMGVSSVLGGELTRAGYVFRRNGMSWEQEGKLTASDHAPLDYGCSVALDGDVAAIGAPFIAIPPPPLQKGGTTDRPGAAYVYRRNADVWAEEAILSASDQEDGNRFGVAVALDVGSSLGNIAVVGADHGCCVRPGAAYVFRLVSAGWEQAAKLTPSDSAPVDLFGSAVAGNGKHIVVGAYGDEPSCIGDPECPALRTYEFAAPCVFGIPALSGIGIAVFAIVLCTVGISKSCRTASCELTEPTAPG